MWEYATKLGSQFKSYFSDEIAEAIKDTYITDCQHVIIFFKSIVKNGDFWVFTTEDEHIQSIIDL
ncbi:hypothetical protein KHQ81_00725 [Mycoplasmatota bacterium]|nr:hypothetical protein KHQ81_00725 [Mycoplasmatota bacterium]